MADGERRHFIIPQAAVHTDAIHSQGRAVKVEREDYSEHGARLLKGSQAVAASPPLKKDRALLDSVFFEIETSKKTSVRKERRRLSDIGLTLVEPLTEHVGVVRTSKDSLGVLLQKLSDYATKPGNPGKSRYAFIERLDEQTHTRALATLEGIPIESTDCVVQIYPGLSEKERSSVLLSLIGALSEAGTPATDSISTDSGLTLVRANLTRAAAKQLLVEFDSIQTIGRNVLFLLPDAGGASTGVHTPVVLPPTGSTAVAILDGGIDPNNPFVAPVVIKTVPAMGAGAILPTYQHGGFVASRAIYGDDVVAQAQSGTLRPLCPIVDVPISGRSATGAHVQPDLLTIVRAIELAASQSPPGTRVLNLSLGTNVAINDWVFSPPAECIDLVSRKHDIVCVVSAGNIRDPALTDIQPNGWLDPASRIDPPGEAILALTVGSIAKRVEPGVQAGMRAVSTFSRRGPGADLGIKPELVAHGGNCHAQLVATPQCGALGISDDGSAVVAQSGTSFAAPLVSSAAARLFDEYDGCQANLVRALMAHFALPVVTPNTPYSAWHLGGFGEVNSEDAIHPRPHSASFVYQGSLLRGQFYHLPFVVPSVMATGSGAGKLRIRATLALDPPTQPSDPQEYALAAMSMTLTRPVGVGRRESRFPSGGPPFVDWSPLIHGERKFVRNYEAGAWDLRVRLWTRGLPDNHLQRFAAVIEIIDDSQTVDLWKTIDDEVGAVFTQAPAKTKAA